MKPIKFSLLPVALSLALAHGVVVAPSEPGIVQLTNTKDGSAVTVTVSDKVTLDKFADKGIAVGDRVRLSYDPAGGSNMSKTFKKAEGC
jgi:hypothetical protein